MPMNLPSSQQPKSSVGKQLPSGDAEDSRSDFPGVASDGGGVLPVGNGQQNLSAQGGRDPATGEGAYDDGGVVDTDQDMGSEPDNDQDDQGAMPPPAPPQPQQQPAQDPMAMVKAALAHGRQRMGLPATFYPSTDNESNGPIGAFDDGGEVPGNEGDDQGQGVIPDDQNQAAGGGQPQGGAIDPRKTMAYLAGAGAMPAEQAAALEQRVDPTGQMDPAERKMKALQMAGSPQAAAALMQRWRMLANAYMGAAHAALDKGNLAQAAQSATKAFEHIPTGHSVQFAPAGRGIAIHARPLGGAPQGGSEPGYDAGGDVAGLQMQQGFDDGGEVDQPQEDAAPAEDPRGAIDRLGDDNLSSNVEDRRGEPPKVGPDGKLLPSETWTDTGRRLSNKIADFRGSVSQGMGVLDTGDEGGSGDPAQPIVTPVQTLKSLLGAGYDKIIEQGSNLGNWLSSLGRSDTKPEQVPMPRPAPPERDDGVQRGGMEKTANPTPVAAQPNAPRKPRDVDQFFNEPITPQSDAEYRDRGLASKYGDLSGELSGASKREREIHMQAERLFPSNVTGNSERRAAYVERMLGVDAQSQGKEHLADISAARRQALEDIKQTHTDERAKGNRENRSDIAGRNQEGVTSRANAQNARVMADEILRQHPDWPAEQREAELQKMIRALPSPASIAPGQQQGSPQGGQGERPPRMYLNGKTYEITKSGKYQEVPRP